MDGDADRKIMQWLGAGPSALQGLSRLLDEHQQLQKQVDAAVQECAKLRQELAAVRAENRHLVDAWSEMDEVLTDGLGKASDAVLRFRATLTAPVTPAPPPAPISPPKASAPASVAATKPEPAPVAAPPAAPPAAAATASPATKSKKPSVPRVLVVDDDPHFRTMMVDYLDKRGYEVHAATSGDEAMATLASVQPHAVLLDLAMPGGGLWAVERIKTSHPELCVIVVSGNDDVSLVAKSRALGAADYVSKPFDLDYLGAILDNHLNSTDAVSVSIMAALAANANGGPVVPTR